MKIKICIPLILSVLVCSSATTMRNKDEQIVAQRPSVKCMENSPERRGEEGCTILSERPLVGSLSKTIYWHIDRFESLEKALAVAGPNGVATEAHGSFWLLTVETTAGDHHAGQHVAQLGPLDLPAAGPYTMRVLSSLLGPGSTTPIHVHSGPEVFYIVDGEQCIELSEAGQHLVAGQSFVVPGGTMHRGRVIGSKARRALAIVLYEAALPASRDFDPSTSIGSCK